MRSARNMKVQASPTHMNESEIVIVRVQQFELIDFKERVIEDLQQPRLGTDERQGKKNWVFEVDG